MLELRGSKVGRKGFILLEWFCHSSLPYSMSIFVPYHHPQFLNEQHLVPWVIFCLSYVSGREAPEVTQECHESAKEAYCQEWYIIGWQVNCSQRCLLCLSSFAIAGREWFTALHQHYSKHILKRQADIVRFGAETCTCSWEGIHLRSYQSQDLDLLNTIQ